MDASSLRSWVKSDTLSMRAVNVLYNWNSAYLSGKVKEKEAAFRIAVRKLKMIKKTAKIHPDKSSLAQTFGIPHSSLRRLLALSVPDAHAQKLLSMLKIPSAADSKIARENIPPNGTRFGAKTKVENQTYQGSSSTTQINLADEDEMPSRTISKKANGDLSTKTMSRGGIGLANTKTKVSAASNTTSTAKEKLGVSNVSRRWTAEEDKKLLDCIKMITL